MKLKTQLGKQLSNLVGKNVNIKETVIGKVTEYDMESGLATIEIDDDLCTNIGWNPIVGQNIGISSRVKLDNET
jgi:hypothetical protein